MRVTTKERQITTPRDGTAMPTVIRAVVIGAWLIVAVVSVSHVIALVDAWTVGNETRIGLDYRAFVAAGDFVRTGQSEVLYTPAFLDAAEVDFVYPPWAAIFMVPWTFLAIEFGLILWTVVGVAVAVVGLRAVGVTDWRFLALASVSFPSVFALGLGQSSFLLVGAVAWSVAAVDRSHDRAGGVRFALAGWKPHLLGGFALLAVSRPARWRSTVAWALVGTGVLVAVSALVMPGSWSAWISFLVESVDELASSILEASLPGMVALALGSLDAVRYLIVGAIALVAVPMTVIALHRSNAGSAERLALATGVWLLLVPHVVIYDVLLMVIPLGMLLHGRYGRDVVFGGSFLALMLSVGPFVTRAQYDTFGRALDVSTLGLIAITVVAASWVVRNRPLLGDAAPPA